MIGNKKEKTNVPAGGNAAINVIGEGTTIVGNLSSNGDLRIDGVVEGTVSTQSKCVLGVSGKIVGNIEANNCDISGRVDGDVQVRELLLIKASGKINGDIKTAKIVVENGGEFNGACSMGSSVSIRKEEKSSDVQAATA